MPVISRNSLVGIALLSALIGGIAGGATVFFLPAARVSSSVRDVRFDALHVPSESTSTEDAETIRVVEGVQAAVVSIVVTKDLPKVRRTPQTLPFLGDPFGNVPLDESIPSGPQKIGGGSGFLVSADGIIVTNRHVVEDPEATYTVLLRSGKQLPAKIVARDPVLDIAVVKIDGDGYPYLSFGNSDALKVGQTVMAIGNALDEFRNTVTKGIVSGLNRRIVAEDVEGAVILEGAIQTDAAINPGNSGGPLIDLRGNVVGVNTAVSRSGQLLGFALPGNLADRDVEQIKKTGHISRSFLGIRYLVIDQDLIDKNHLTVDHGVLVARGDKRADVAVVPGSPADRAGIQENDILLEINGVRIDEEHSLSSLMSRVFPNEQVTLKILRHGEEKEVRATLDEFKPAS